MNHNEPEFLKHLMPKNKKELLEMLFRAFMAGCTWGYGVEHTCDMQEQEEVGARYWIGEISKTEAEKQLERILSRV